jgi:hypothetical protein
MEGPPAVDTADASEQAEDHPQLAPPPAELAVSQAQFPCFRICREETCDRALYVARSLHLGLNPHTVVTGDIGELSAALEPARHVTCPRPHPAGQAPSTRPVQASAS